MGGFFSALALCAAAAAPCLSDEATAAARGYEESGEWQRAAEAWESLEAQCPGFETAYRAAIAYHGAQDRARGWAALERARSAGVPDARRDRFNQWESALRPAPIAPQASGSRAAGWTCLGVGLVTAVAGGLLFLGAQDPSSALAAGVPAGPEHDRLAQEVTAFNAGGGVGVGLGAALIITGAVLLGTTDGAGDSAFLPWLAPGPTELVGGVTLRF